jgi:hypothetical protein
MYIRLGTNLERDSRGGGIGIVYSLRTSLDIRAHTVVVTCGDITKKYSGGEHQAKIYGICS